MTPPYFDGKKSMLMNKGHVKYINLSHTWNLTDARGRAEVITRIQTACSAFHNLAVPSIEAEINMPLSTDQSISLWEYSVIYQPNRYLPISESTIPYLCRLLFLRLVC